MTEDESEVEQRHRDGDHSECDKHECDWALCSQITTVGDRFIENEYCENQVRPHSDYCAYHDGD